MTNKTPEKPKCTFCGKEKWEGAFPAKCKKTGEWCQFWKKQNKTPECNAHSSSNSGNGCAQCDSITMGGGSTFHKPECTKTPGGWEEEILNNNRIHTIISAYLSVETRSILLKELFSIIKQTIQEKDREIMRLKEEFINGERCLDCAGIKDNRLSDSCGDCLENN